MTAKSPTRQTPDVASLRYADTFVAEDDLLTAAREQGSARGCRPMDRGSAALLRFLAAAKGAQHVVEIGTGVGVTSLWLLRGMPEDGVLTSIDLESDFQRSARETLQQAGIAPGRFRLITGRALEVLPRLTDAAYDMVVVDADVAEYGLYLEQALRLLRPGGIVAFNNALLGGRIADPAQRDEVTLAQRELVAQIHDNDRLTEALVPTGTGLLLLTVR